MPGVQQQQEQHSLPSFKVGPPPYSPLGAVIPADTPHAVSVSLPTWKDNVDYEEGEQRIKDAMSSGYPRFYIHHQIQQLADLAILKFGNVEEESCLLMPTRNTALGCVSFLASRSPQVNSRVQEWAISSSSLPNRKFDSSEHEIDPVPTTTNRTIIVYLVCFRTTDFAVAKQYWQHTGDGISSRLAERCLILLGQDESPITSPQVNQDRPPTLFVSLKSNSRYGAKAGGGRYGVVKPSTTAEPSATSTSSSGTTTPAPVITSKLRYTPRTRTSATKTSPDASEPSSLSSSIHDSLPPSIDQDEDILTRYVEERYGRNLDLSLAPLAKLAMRRRIAGVLKESPGQPTAIESIQRSSETEQSSRGIRELTEKDVWLYPGGMSAIFHSHQLAMAAWEKKSRPVGKSVCFGFPYTDTLKILEKWGPGCEFFGRGLAQDIPALRSTLEKAEPPILALYCEFPSNPLLRTPPLGALRKLADEFGFLIVVDETIAGFVNVEVLPLADIVVSSLTKVFSGDSNVMGGRSVLSPGQPFTIIADSMNSFNLDSLVLNPKGAHYSALKEAQEASYEDFYFDEDAIYMERNSRDFQERIELENYNAETLCEFLRSKRSPGPSPLGVITPPAHCREGSVIKEVYYPKYMTPENYEASLRKSASAYASGYGALFSLTFTSLAASAAFFDALPCYKGPSLGTNFTLACPYTILAHYTETDWALEWGVEKGLIRVSVGLEDVSLLKGWFEAALIAAENAEREAKE